MNKSEAELRLERNSIYKKPDKSVYDKLGKLIDHDDEVLTQVFLTQEKLFKTED